MRLLRFGVCAIGAQLVLTHLLINLFAVNYVWFALWLAVAAHIVIEIASISSLDRTHGFKLFILTYLVGELYLFAVALLGSFYEFGIMGLLHSRRVSPFQCGKRNVLFICVIIGNRHIYAFITLDRGCG